MPKRVIDAEAAWGSSKLANCKEEFIPEYTWLYGLADAYGNFELNDLRVIHGKVAAIRPHFSIETLQQVLEDFHKNGLLFTWYYKGKKYGHWTGSDKPGRLPPKSQREHYPKLDIPQSTKGAQDESEWPELQKYLTGIESEERRSPGLFAGATEEEIEEEAEALADGYAERASKNGDEVEQLRRAKFEIFWNLYPNKRREPGAYLQFRKLSVLEMDDAIAAIEQWEASNQWQDPQFVPFAKNFLKNGDWKVQPPKEPGNAKRIGSQVEPDEITKRNLRNSGLTGPRATRHSR